MRRSVSEPLEETVLVRNGILSGCLAETQAVEVEVLAAGADVLGGAVSRWVLDSTRDQPARRLWTVSTYP